MISAGPQRCHFCCSPMDAAGSPLTSLSTRGPSFTHSLLPSLPPLVGQPVLCSPPGDGGNRDDRDLDPPSGSSWSPGRHRQGHRPLYPSEERGSLGGWGSFTGHLTPSGGIGEDLLQEVVNQGAGEEGWQELGLLVPSSSLYGHFCKAGSNP